MAISLHGMADREQGGRGSGSKGSRKGRGGLLQDKKRGGHVQIHCTVLLQAIQGDPLHSLGDEACVWMMGKGNTLDTLVQVTDV